MAYTGEIKDKRIRDFQEATNHLFEIYSEKNERYQDSFHKQFESKGLSMSLVRLEDKFLRFQALVENPDLGVNSDESIIDTLLDLANYSIMTYIELNNKKKEG